MGACVQGAIVYLMESVEISWPAATEQCRRTMARCRRRRRWKVKSLATPPASQILQDQLAEVPGMAGQ